MCTDSESLFKKKKFETELVLAALDDTSHSFSMVWKCVDGTRVCFNKNGLYKLICHTLVWSHVRFRELMLSQIFTKGTKPYRIQSYLLTKNNSNKIKAATYID